MDPSNTTNSLQPAESGLGGVFLISNKDMLNSPYHHQAVSLMRELQEQDRPGVPLQSLPFVEISEEKTPANPEDKRSRDWCLGSHRSLSTSAVGKTNSKYRTSTSSETKQSDHSSTAKIRCLATPASIYDEEQAPSQSPYSVAEQEKDVTKAISRFRASKLAKAGARESHWAVPKPHARDQEMKPFFQSRAPPPPFRRTEIEYTMEQLIAILANPESDEDRHDLMKARKNLRTSIMKTQIHLHSSQQTLMIWFSSAIKAHRYNHDKDLLRQFLLSVLIACSLGSAHERRDCLIPLLRSLIGLVKSHSYRDAPGKTKVEILHEVCIKLCHAIIVPFASDCGEQMDQEFISEYLTTQIKIGLKLATKPLACLASTIPDLLLQSNLLRNLSRHDHVLWEMLSQRRIPFSVVEAAISLQYASASKNGLVYSPGRQLEGNQVWTLLRILLLLPESTEAERAVLAMLANHDWNVTPHRLPRTRLSQQAPII